MITDTVFDKNEINKTVNFYSLDSNSNMIYRGCKNFNNDFLFESIWISESKTIFISQMYFGNGSTSFINITFKDIYIQLISFYENGNIRSLINYNPDGVENGWSFEYDESGNLFNKTLYSDGVEVIMKKKSRSSKLHH
jgi:hypothetical protein